jgi:hypothetical protein
VPAAKGILTVTGSALRSNCDIFSKYRVFIQTPITNHDS